MFDEKTAEQILAEIANFELVIEKLTNAADLKIIRIREDLKNSLDPLQAELKIKDLSFKKYIKDNRTEFKTNRQRTCAFGKYGLIERPKYHFPAKETLLAALKEARLTEYIQTEETVKQTSLKADFDSLPAALGITKTSKDEVFYKIDKEGK